MLPGSAVCCGKGNCIVNGHQASMVMNSQGRQIDIGYLFSANKTLISSKLPPTRKPLPATG
jgi:hypothetical protein